MLYKPNFCCHCGEKIERLAWSPFTSRRFCELCETEQKPYDYLPRVVVAIGIFLGLVGVAGLASDEGGSNLKSSKPEQSAALKRGIKSRVPNERAAEKGNTASSGNAVQPVLSNANAVSAAAPVDENLKQRAREAKTSTEAAYFCNALTKKGTPCTRRVKTKGRCWQHQGRPAVDRS